MVNASKLGFIALKCGHLTPCSGIPFLVYSLSHTHTLSLSLSLFSLSAVRNTWAGRGSMPVVFPPGMADHPCPTLRAKSLSLQGEPADIGKG